MGHPNSVGAAASCRPAFASPRGGRSSRARGPVPAACVGAPLTIRRTLRSLLACGVAAAGLAQAATLGTIGPIYPIAEKNLLDLIAERLRAKERSGELARLQQDSVARATRP